MNLDINIVAIWGILITHYIADFVLQTQYQAANKSKCNFALGSHVLTYYLALIPVGVITLGFLGLLWATVNALLHFCTDYVTSRMSSKRWKEQRWHDFFVVVGADQLCHYITLFGSYFLFTLL